MSSKFSREKATREGKEEKWKIFDEKQKIFDLDQKLVSRENLHAKLVSFFTFTQLAFFIVIAKKTKENIREIPQTTFFILLGFEFLEEKRWEKSKTLKHYDRFSL